ncbi:MAG: hypothetical protein J6B10_00025 [Lachnospiraceae bacterium]|nr:hypothetical protein [Lachnospiraceae bacterium]
METVEDLKKSIADAEMVLVGIGEEFETDWEKMKGIQPYAEWLAEIAQKEDAKWLIPYIRAHYLEQMDDERLREAYSSLNRLLEKKNYFLVSLCTDGRMEKLKWKEDRLVFPCGGYTKLQCENCKAELTDAGQTVDAVIQKCQQQVGSLERIERPVCRHCGAKLEFNNIYFAEEYDETGYLPAWDIYMKWLQGTINRKLCVIELGVGLKFPSVIRWPFEKAAFFNQKASFFRVHSRLYQMSEELADRGVSIAQNPIDFLRN